MSDEELLKEWVAALRSGKYTQGKGKLKTCDGHYCCLGVLCEVAVENNYKDLHYDKDCYCFTMSVDGESHKEFYILPYPIIIPSRDGKFNITPRVKEYLECGTSYNFASLTLLNDNGLSFNQIADLIEIINAEKAWVK